MATDLKKNQNPLPCSNSGFVSYAKSPFDRNISRPQIGFNLGGCLFTTIVVVLLNCQVFSQGGRLDWTFPQVLANDSNVTAIETQADGKILIAGKFNTVGPILRKDVVRLNPDGSIDAAFNAGTGSDNNGGSVLIIKLQTDGKILIAGTFNTFNGTFRNAVMRLNSDGSIDPSFVLSGLDVTLAFDMDIQADGKILVSATNLNGSSFIARFNTNGSNDGAVGQPFFAVNGSNSYRFSYVESENKILVSAKSVSLGNQINLMKVNTSGAIDQTFSAAIIGNRSNLQVFLRPLATGKILIWGKFDAVNQVTRRNIAMLNSNGSVDASFDPATVGPETILATAIQNDGKIIIGGRDFVLNNAVRGNIARLNANGSVDSTFNPGRGADKSVKSVKIRGNKLLIGGDFLRFHLFPRAGLAQLKL